MSSLLNIHLIPLKSHFILNYAWSLDFSNFVSHVELIQNKVLCGCMYVQEAACIICNLESIL